ncbi:hypothetical protein [Protofrankia symbiont of Coriaria ruscifolia]|uniref:hypothetical protein n=1 Tax=Protofrankia symbiont of Coriaria ruscifolia TaxID=1306542 RepID=UPI001A941900|nr:hypothetical protein [Protofrankia symbiont of Coriaria ruscifolia]
MIADGVETRLSPSSLSGPSTNRLPYMSSALTQPLMVATTALVPKSPTEHLDEAEAIRMAATWSSSRGSNQPPVS